jgi:uncharacterized linocin/CFP29 family protein
MDPALENFGWTEEQWNRICTTVTEEAQKARVAAQLLPAVGPEEPSTVAIPPFTLTPQSNPYPFPQTAPPPQQATQRLWVESNPTLPITTISVNVPLRGHEMADPDLKAALTMFRRAANYVARVEDALVFNGRPVNAAPALGLAGIPPVYTVTGDLAAFGLFSVPAPPPTPGPIPQLIPAAPPPVSPAVPINPRPPPLGNIGGDQLFTAIVQAIGQLEANGQLAPFACVLGQDLFDIACTPNPNFVLPRDRILPFLQGPLLRSTATLQPWLGAIIALSGSPVELVVATDINVQFLQTSLEPRYVFRVYERVALRIKEWRAIAILTP